MLLSGIFLVSLADGYYAVDLISAVGDERLVVKKFRIGKSYYTG